MNQLPTVEQYQAWLDLAYGPGVYKAAQDGNGNFYAEVVGWPDSEVWLPAEPLKIKCECGSEKAELPTHSTWCPKHEAVQ
jgi:hypothetical protein